MIHRLILSVLTFFLSSFLLIGSSTSAQELRWSHFGLRPLGMGNAFVSVVDDYNTIFYNPAGLARLKEWDGEFLNPQFEISQKTGSFISDAQDLAAGSAGDTKAVLDLIEDNAGNVQHFGLGMTPHLIFRGFGFGLGMQINASFIFHRYPSIEIDLGPDLILPISMAMNFLEDRLSIGFGVKMRVRGGIKDEFDIQKLQAFSKSDSDSEESPKLEDSVRGGIGAGADFGILFTPIKTMEPTLGISIMDIGGTSFDKFDVGGESVGTPDVVLPSVNVGVSAKPIMNGSQYLLASVDIHAINQPVSFSKKLNLGVEYGWGDLFKLQTGLHQGYLTAGLQFDVGLLNIRMATYGEELGPVAGSVEDRRYVMQFKLLI